jgi:hypothetical protein
MLITDIIEYFRRLANEHRQVACYRTGEAYELNETELSYPLLFLNTDFTTSFSSTADLIDGEYVFVTFRLSVITKSREAYDAKPDNQIKMIGQSTKQDADLALTHQILNQIVTRAMADFNEDYLNGWILTGDNGGIALKRIINDDCDGWNVDLTIKAHNETSCNYEDAFGDDIIDSGTNKTEFQQPINVNPI